MWDYDKLFSEGNIIGVKNIVKGTLFPMVVEKNNTETLNLYKNDKLTFHAHCVVDVSHSYSTDFEIQYIIRLDEHGNVVERLFDRERDMPEPKTEPMPELKEGMFIRVAFSNDYLEQDFGFVSLIRKQIIYQHEGYDWIDNIKYWENTKIIEIYSPEVLSFKNCQYSVPIWRSPEYQAYLDSKYN